ncbi:sigma-54 dependent transcriptional regulator [Myxococcota bacterium]|nr:sigma-54 dependent transcriptional regulator [Myxococcota bacterium]
MKPNARVLVVDDEENMRHMLSLVLSKDGFHVWTAGNGREALELLRTSERFDVCVSDVRMPGMDGLAFIASGVKLGARAPTFIAMSAYGDEKLALEALNRGALDYISKPFPPEQLSLKLRRFLEKSGALEDKSGDAAGARSTRRPSTIDEIVSRSEVMTSILRTVKKVASFPTTVLLTGETGTGKERIAGAIHMEGKRRDKPFVAINCGAIPENLLESELFGHVKGAFTDANADRQGLFEVANGGTLFLDEIGELPLSLQVKLLRALVEKEIRRVGDTKTIPVDVRVIAATSRDLDALREAGTFREDLYYRLAVVSIHLPPLRERPEDVPLLAEHFAKMLGQRLGLGEVTITTEAMRVLEGYAWPGNVRELENALERAIVLSDGGQRITIGDLDERFDQAPAPSSAGAMPASATFELGDDLSFKVQIPRLEQHLIHRALKRTNGNRTKAASVLGISHRALLYKLKEYGIS